MPLLLSIGIVYQNKGSTRPSGQGSRPLHVHLLFAPLAARFPFLQN